ncbi:hypothetical protein ACQJBY_016363 [Aegilops geniculata]
MDPLDYLSVRFHYRGEFEHDGNDWVYVGGKTGLSTIEFPELSVSGLKKNLADFVTCSDLALQNTKLHWKYPDGDLANALLVLDDQKSVEMMAKHVTDAGVIDIYAVIPADESHEGIDWEFEFAEQFQAEHCYAEQVHVDEGHAEEVQAEQRNAEYVQCRAKMPVFRAASSVSDKGKGVATEEMQFSGESDSDSDYVVPPAESNSSAEDEEIIEYRKYAKEFKEKRRKKMLGEEEAQACNVTDDFIVPETCKLDDDADDTPYFESDDDLSYDEASDGEVNAVRRRKTTHKVYDGSTDNPQFEVGMAFTDSREFKQALVKYGLKNFHHLLFPKDEKRRVSAKCSWTGCQWSIYGSINSKSDWLLVQRYNNVHTCVLRRDNKLVTSSIIAKKYFRQIRDNPTWRVEKMQEAVLEDLLADVTISKCKRAKKLVMEKLIDSTNGENSRVFDYHLELIRSNPGSTVAVTLDPEEHEKNVFERMYVCLDGCKKGFMAGCRRVVGLDGCFLKGAVHGQILCAIGRDANNQMYPIAWATVEVESYDSWINQQKQPGKKARTHLSKQVHALSQQQVHKQLQGHQQGLQQLQGYQHLQELLQLQGHQGHLGHQGLQILSQAHLHHKFQLMVMGGSSGF